MKNFLIVLVFFMFMCSLSFSQSEEKAAATVPPPEEPCDWAYLFSWKPGLDIGKYYISKIPSRDIDDPIQSIGIGAERYLSDYSSLYGGLSVGISSQTTPTTGGENEFSQTEFGLKLGYNMYFKGKDARISPYWGPWVSYAALSETQTDKPTTGTETEIKYSASTIGVGLSGGVYAQPWEDLDLDLGFQYNLGVMISPSSTVTSPGIEGNPPVESDGPSSTSIGDCGGNIILRLSF